MSRRGKALRIALLCALSGIAYELCVRAGKAADCAPNQIDGQCGLASAMGTLFGFGLGGIVLIVGLLFLFIRWSKQK